LPFLLFNSLDLSHLFWFSLITLLSEQESRRDPVTGVSNNDRSIGIGIINPLGLPEYTNGEAYVATDEMQPYTYEQYVSVVRLCGELVSAYPDIEHRIIGHNDVSCGPAERQNGIPNDRYHTRKRWDPGNRFEWERLEAAGLGMWQLAAENADIYGSVFSFYPGISLRQGDRDRGPTRLGGNTIRGYSQSPIATIKQDLREIGYSLRNVDGSFDAWTSGAVDRFKRHFFSGARDRRTGGEIDFTTASMIRRIRLFYHPE